MAAPVDPPLRHPVRDQKSANHTDATYWELISRDSDVFQQNAPLKRGQKYSDLRGATQSIIDLHPTGLWFSEEVVPMRSSQVGGMPGHHFVIWVWSTDWRAQSSTNAGITYSGESTAHPIYSREYVIRRDAWEAAQSLTTLTALTALIGATITGAGINYTYATGTVGNATLAFVCSGGALIAAIVTSEGSSITAGAAITIIGDGTGATATAVIQPATAVLVAQEKSELPQDSNLSKEFVGVQRIWETLPGPYLPFTRYDDDLGPIQGRRRAVVNTGQAAVLTPTSKKTYEAREGSSVVSWELEESWSDGTGADGAATNPAYPVNFEDIYDAERGAVQQMSQIVRATGTEVGSLTTVTGYVSGFSIVNGGSGYTTTAVTISGGGGTGATAIATLTAGVVTGFFITNPGRDYSGSPSAAVAGDGSGAAVSLSVTAGALAIKTEYTEFEGNRFLLKKTVETWAMPGPVLRNAERYDEKLGIITGTRQLVVAASQVQTMSASGQTRYDATSYGDAILWKIVESWSATFPIRTNDPYDDERGAVQSISQLITAASVAGSLAESGGTATKIIYEAYNEFLLDRTTETWASAGPTFTGKEMSEAAQGALTDTSRQLLAASAAAYSPTWKTLSYRDVPLNVAQKRREHETLPDAAFPILSEVHVDEATGIKIDITKQIIEAAVAVAAATGTYDELQALNKWRSILISSALRSATLPADRTWEGIMRHSFPDILTNPTVELAVGTEDIDVGFFYDLHEGYSGPCDAIFTEKFLTAAEFASYSAPAITKYIPQAAVFFFSGVVNDRGRIYPFNVPMSLHDEFSPELDGLDSNPVTIPATDPIDYESEDEIYVDVQTEKWRFGVWRVLEIKVIIP